MEDEEESDEGPLHWVDCNETDDDIERMLARVRSDRRSLDSFDRDTSSALYRAVSYDHYWCTYHLLKAGADPNVASPVTPVHVSVFGPSLELTELLLEHGGSANSLTGGNKCDIIVSACRMRKFDTVKLLLDYGAIVQDMDYLRNLRPGHESYIHKDMLVTPLAVAALEGLVDVFQLLLSRGAKPTISAAKDGVVCSVQDAHCVPRLLSQETSGSDELKCQMLSIFWSFGGDPLQKVRGTHAYYNNCGNPNHVLRDYAKQLACKMRPLSDICRLAIVGAISGDYFNGLEYLVLNKYLPKPLHGFLRFES